MDDGALLEHETKTLLREHGVAVPRGAFAPIPALAAEAADRIGYPVVVKAQVHARGRRLAGGIAEAATPREVREAGAVIMNAPIRGEHPAGLLVEELVRVAEEHRLMVALDPAHLTVAFAAGEGAPATVTTPRDDTAALERWLAGLPLPERQRRALRLVVSGAAAAAAAHGLAAIELDPIAWTGTGYVALDAQAFAEVRDQGAGVRDEP